MAKSTNAEWFFAKAVAREWKDRHSNDGPYIDFNGSVAYDDERKFFCVSNEMQMILLKLIVSENKKSHWLDFSKTTICFFVTWKL
jgi:hypothetical protein